jgi:YD repeat-containing protein
MTTTTRTLVTVAQVDTSDQETRRAGGVVEQEFDGGIRRYERDRGRLVRIARPSGTTVEYAYDAADRPITIRNRRRGGRA